MSHIVLNYVLPFIDFIEKVKYRVDFKRLVVDYNEDVKLGYWKSIKDVIDFNNLKCPYYCYCIDCNVNVTWKSYKEFNIPCVCKCKYRHEDYFLSNDDIKYIIKFLAFQNYVVTCNDLEWTIIKSDKFYNIRELAKSRMNKFIIKIFNLSKTQLYELTKHKNYRSAFIAGRHSNIDTIIPITH